MSSGYSPALHLHCPLLTLWLSLPFFVSHSGRSHFAFQTLTKPESLERSGLSHFNVQNNELCQRYLHQLDLQKRTVSGVFTDTGQKRKITPINIVQHPVVTHVPRPLQKRGCNLPHLKAHTLRHDNDMYGGLKSFKNKVLLNNWCVGVTSQCSHFPSAAWHWN